MSRLIATLLACISTTVITEAQEGGSEAKHPPRTFIQDHSHLTYALEKGFLTDHALQA